MVGLNTDYKSLIDGIEGLSPYILAAALLFVFLTGVLFIVFFLALKVFLKRWLGIKTNLPFKDSVIALSDEYFGHAATPERRRDAAVSLATFVLQRQASQLYFQIVFSIFGGLIGVSTVYLLYHQNERIALQTDANIAESILSESTRRASILSELNALIASASDDVDSDKPDCSSSLMVEWEGCWEFYNVSERGSYFLESGLASRVSAYAKRSTPYRISVPRIRHLDFDVPLRDQLSFPNLSPERGILFEALARNRIDTRFFDFSFSALNGTDLRNLRIIESNLSGSDLSEVNLSNALLSGADLSDADLSGANLEGAILRNANLSNANLSGALLWKADFCGVLTELSGVKTEGAWTWSNDPPKCLPQSVKITSCVYIPEIHYFYTRPNDC